MNSTVFYPKIPIVPSGEDEEHSVIYAILLEQGWCSPKGPSSSLFQVGTVYYVCVSLCTCEHGHMCAHVCICVTGIFKLQAAQFPRPAHIRNINSKYLKLTTQSSLEVLKFLAILTSFSSSQSFESWFILISRVFSYDQQQDCGGIYLLHLICIFFMSITVLHEQYHSEKPNFIFPPHKCAFELFLILFLLLLKGYYKHSCVIFQGYISFLLDKLIIRNICF